MAGFDQHAHCARCRDKKKGSDPCVKGNICPSCPRRLATPVERKARNEISALVDPSLVSVLGVVADGGNKNSEEVSSTPVVAKTKKNADDKITRSFCGQGQGKEMSFFTGQIYKGVDR